MPAPTAPTTTTNNNKKDDTTTIVTELEQHAAAVVRAICVAVDTIRNTTTTKSKKSPSHLYQQLHQAVNLQGLIQQGKALQSTGILVRLKAVYGDQINSLTDADDAVPPRLLASPPTPLQQDFTERLQIVCHILWPLLQLLAHVYTYLDLLPTPPPTTRSKEKGTPKPPPPPGLLSLQNYTDIAALAEFTICTSICALMEPHVLPQVRQRPLPKALQGRLPRSCLLLFEQQEQKANDVTPHKNNPLLRWVQEWYELLATTTVIGQVIVPLDRFRPILLPRHVTDLFAALWQAKAWQVELQKHASVLAADSRYGWWWQQGQLLAQTSRQSLLLPLDNSPHKGATTLKVDDTTLALTCLRLLQYGRQAPVWLQRQVSQTLQALAYRNLAAVMAVYCPVNDASAPMRLARTLTTGPRRQYEKVIQQQQQQQPPTTTTSIWKPLLLQVVHVLDQIVASTTKDDSSLNMAQATWTEAHQSRIHALWAILDQLPNDVLTTLVLPLFQDAEMHPRVRRWTALFQFIPPFVDLVRMGEHLLFVHAQGGTNEGTHVVQLLWDLALTPSVVVHKVQEDATYALQSWSHAVLAANFANVDSLDVFSCALLRLLSSGPAMRQFAIIASDGKGLDNVVAVETLAETTDLTQIMARLEKSSKFAIDKLILALSQESVAKSNMALPSRLLQLLVLLYLSFGNPTAKAMVPWNLLTPACELAIMTLLPLLCEECSMENLLADAKSSTPLLKLIETVLQTVSLQASSETSDHATTDGFYSMDVAKTNDVVTKMMRLDQTVCSTDDSFPVSLGGDESKLSIASVLLTLLVGLLELGAPNRTAEEEETFKLMAPALKIISESNGTATVDESTSMIWSELSEMASHANALIAARDARASSNSVSDEVADPVLRQYLQAKEDLTSPEPPVRARGVVTLRRLTFVVGEPTKPLLIEERRTGGEIAMSDVMELAINALQDKESYVFLAAIQTIAAGATQQPTSVVRKLCIALARGLFPSRDSDTLHLSAEQRIKLAEALVAFVRRRASMNEHLDDVLGTLFHATKRNQQAVSPVKADLIQAETHRYFTGANKEDEMEEDKWEQTQLRGNTGGPVFDNEEDDVVRGAAINLVSEVVRFASPAVLSRFAPLLVDCARVALQLEAARPLRRSGAYLASSLYYAMIREVEGHDPKLLSKQQLECPFTVATVSSDEESLAVVVSRVEKGNDLMDLDAEKGRRFDPATVARCKEALEARQHLIDSGVLALAKLSMDKRKEFPSILHIYENPATKDNGASPFNN